MAALPKTVRSCITTHDTTTALCLTHCKVAAFIFGEERAEGFRFYLGGAADAAFIGKEPEKERVSTRIRRRREGSGTVGSCGGNGFGIGS